MAGSAQTAVARPLDLEHFDAEPQDHSANYEEIDIDAGLKGVPVDEDEPEGVKKPKQVWMRLC